MGAAILENMPVTRSKDSTLFREISREIFTVRVDRTATCVGFREISREMLWPNARWMCRTGPENPSFVGLETGYFIWCLNI